MLPKYGSFIKNLDNNINERIYMKRNDSIPGKWCDDIASKIKCSLANYTVGLHTNTVYEGGQRPYNL